MQELIQKGHWTIKEEKPAFFVPSAFQALTSAFVFETFSTLKFALGTRICFVVPIT
jgi:hypothetical protein